MSKGYTVRDITNEDLLRDLAGIDDEWLHNAPMSALLNLVKQFRGQARFILEKQAGVS